MALPLASLKARLAQIYERYFRGRVSGVGLRPIREDVLQGQRGLLAAGGQAQGQKTPEAVED